MTRRHNALHNIMFKWAPSSATVNSDVSTAACTTLYPRITALRLGLMSAEEIERVAGAVITEHTLYAKNVPKLGGPNDPGMGPSDRRVLCNTCRCSWFRCPNHTGVLRLPVPLYHVGYMEMTFKLLQVVCWACSRLLATPASDPAAATVPLGPFHAAFAAGHGKFLCPWCDCPQPKYKRAGGMVVTREWTDAKLARLARLSPGLAAEARRTFTPADALAIFAGMPDEDIAAVGMDPVVARPASLIMQNVCVLPPNARPTIMAAEGSKRRGQDDITSQLQDIVKACRKLRRAMVGPAGGKPDGAATPEYECYGGCGLTAAEVTALRDTLPGAVVSVSAAQAAAVWAAHPALCERLQNDVTVMINNKGRYAPLARQRTGATKRSIMERLVGKQGRIRCNIFARRTDQTARTVIKPDRYLDVDQLGIPHVFMNTLTKPEEVHAGNRARLQAAVDRGPGVHHGAARVLRASGQLVQLHLQKADMPRVVLAIGDVVERHLVDGDRAVFNRQPTLHRLSFMAHRLKAVPGQAVAVPLAVMAPYNADCDGDEMNLHVLQSVMGDAEMRELLAVHANIMNPQTNGPCLSVVQDARVGAFLLTASTTVLDAATMANCMAAVRYVVPGKERLPPPGAGTSPPLWTGKQLFSLLLPRGVFLRRWVRGADASTPVDDPDERVVVIHDGDLQVGRVCKATLGTGAGGLVHKVFAVAGPEGVIRFLSDLQRVVYTWLPGRGLSIGLEDCVAPAATTAAVQAAVQDADTVVEALTRRAADLADAMTHAEAATLEAHVLTVLTSVLDYASRRVLADGAPSAFRDIVTSGSKGNANNVAQVMACLGQQVVEGERVQPSAVSRRTLPCFPPGAYSAQARGFITHSYLDGMRPAEYFMHAKAGREGLVATAVKTAETGYKYRVMAKSMETNVVRWDGTTRNAQNYILECVAGGDGLNACAVERVDLAAVLRAGVQDVVARVGGTVAPAVLAAQAYLRRGLWTPCFPEGVTKVVLPCNPAEELAALRFALAAGRVRPEAAASVGHARDDDDALAGAVQGLGVRLQQFFPLPAVCWPLQLALAWDLCPAALREAGLHSVAAFEATLAPIITRRVLRALVAPGESVGIVAAQSIGEPSTQFTLNVFHHAGLLQRHLTVGVPRLKELLHASVRIRTPTMTVPFRASADADARTLHKLAKSLQFLCLDGVVHSSYVVVDPVTPAGAPLPTLIVKDLELLRHVHQVFGAEPEGASPHVIRMTLNRAVLTEHGFTPEAVARAVAAHCAAACVVYSEPNMQRWVIRVRHLTDTSDQTARLLHADLRDSVLLGGIDGVHNTRVIATPVATADTATGRIVTHSRPAIDVDGAALRPLATRDWVDWAHVTTNDVMEVAEVLGLAAARAVLFAELDRIVCYDGGYVDPRHLAQIVTSMTQRGFVMPLTRHGINRVDFSVLQRASFEEPVDMLLQGAASGVLDPLRGLCECVYVGAKAPVGTGTVAVQSDFGGGLPARVTVASRELSGLPGPAKRFRDSRRESKGGGGDGAGALSLTQLLAQRRRGVAAAAATVAISADGTSEVPGAGTDECVGTDVTQPAIVPVTFPAVTPDMVSAAGPYFG